MIKFEATEKEARDVDNWIASHQNEKHGGKAPYAGAIGGAYKYIFSPTGLGVCISVKCMCGEEFNATDYSEW